VKSAEFVFPQELEVLMEISEQMLGLYSESIPLYTVQLIVVSTRVQLTFVYTSVQLIVVCKY
jgi:hypothetical protein